MVDIINENHKLLGDIRHLIEAARAQVAVTVNSTMTMLYWHIGDRINHELLNGSRAAYGKQVIAQLSQRLTEVYGGREFSEKNLNRMRLFASRLHDLTIWTPLVSKLSWSHFLQVIPLENDLQRNFYLTMAADQRWSKRTLKAKIDSMLFERTAIAKKPEDVVLHDLEKLRNEHIMSSELIFQDPYVLDFLGLHDNYSEKDLESAIIAELQRFIIELGNDFAFLARQKRITVDNEDYYIDLLFYHRRLRSLVAIDLKLGRFQASYKGQMELYLRWLEKYDMAEGENKPIGLILCAGKNQEHVELMHLNDSNIRVADYLTKLPERNLLEQKLKQAIAIAEHRLNSPS